ncbi:MAG TPA: regulatory iron-sulfur-containing complex subunit RicT [Gemmatimonadaceae bacterium]
MIEVCFKGNRKEFFLWEGEDPPALKSGVIVEADRGEDLGHVHAVGDAAQLRAKGVSHGPGETPVSQVARRLASGDDLKRLKELREQDETARRKATERVKANGLAMKLSDAEWRWDRRKLTIYFTADKRVDFRNLVRELASTFRTRIELKQIGVRDEAKRLSGIGRCGREYCSASWLPELRPVNLGVAKEQRLSLNPSQISGACGRLMCCLRYEHEFYVAQRKRFPKEGKVVATTKGQEKIILNDIFRERVTLRSEEGETRLLSLAEFRAETGGERVHEPTGEDEAFVSPAEGVSEEVILLQDTVERPAWVPRSPDAPRATSSTRQLPVAQTPPEPPARAERVSVTAEPEPDDDAAEDEDEDASAPPEAGADARPERRRRRRGRRGGRRNRGPERGSDGGSGGGAEGGPS